jgi:hypothetical protein
MAGLNGKEVAIKIYQADKVRETIRIPIKAAGESTISILDSQTSLGIREHDSRSFKAVDGTAEPVRSDSGTVSGEKVSTGRDLDNKGGWTVPGIWILQIFNLVGLIALALYGAFFLLPKLQVIEARMSKNEMFLLGAREAIREELDKTKEDVLRQCGVSTPPKDLDES